ncbi:MAG: DHA2 family efflux MFS transporter permease subunit [Fimbriimonas sp.]|nr:DHA2 family efflux MFS transporter permease subunit [Fimbriimonas sp.]
MAIPVRGDQSAYGRNRWLLLLGFALAAALEVLDVSIVNPVMPTMAGNLGCTTEEIGWISTAYLLANVVFLPLTDWFSRKFGLGRYVSVSIGAFVVASVFCGMSHSLGQMIFFRIIQGAAGAPLISMTQAGIAEVFPRREQNLAQGVWALCIIVAPSIAPYLGGWISDNYAWPWVFYINLPIGIVAATIVMTNYKDRAEYEASGSDLLGIGLLTIGLGSIQYVLEEGNSKDWFSNPLIVRLTWVGAIGTVLFAVWELSPFNRSPVVNLRVMRHWGFSGATIVSFISGIALYSGVFIFPIFAQAVLGFTATKSGYFMLLPGLIMGVAMMMSTVAIERGVPARDVAILGIFVCTLSMWMLGHSTPMSNESDNQIGLIVRNVGLATMLLPVMTAGVIGLDRSEVGAGASLLGLARQLGGSFGIALAASQLTRMTQFHRYHLMDRVVQGGSALSDRVDLLTGAFYSRGMDMSSARQGAERIVDLQVTRQAYTLAVNNVYILTAILFFIALPFVFLMKREHSQGPAVTH